MLAELLLVLSGHPSCFFIPSPPAPRLPTTYITSPTLAEYLHPGELASLNVLAQLAFRYSRIRQWAQSVQQAGREALLAETVNRKGKSKEVTPGPGIYLATLAGALLDVLKEYEYLIVDVETRILQLDSALVQDEKGYVPLGSLVATFDPWQGVMMVLENLVDQITRPPPKSSMNKVDGTDWRPGKLMDLIQTLGVTGNPRIADIFAKLLQPLQQLFLTHLISFLLFGIAPTSSTPTSPTIAIDKGADPQDPQHRLYALEDGMFSSSIGEGTRESILYVGRVAATLKREGKSLPNIMMMDLKQQVMASRSDEDLQAAVKHTRMEVGEWLWRHILTGPQVIDSLNAFGDYFLTRNGEYAVSVIREIHRLRMDKIVKANPHSSSSIIREQDLYTALLRASVGTSAETDRSVEKLAWKMEHGPLRPLMPSLTASQRKAKSTSYTDEGSVRDLFSSSLLGTPLSLSMTVGWPLDLFVTPATSAAYSDIHSYLFAFRDTHLRVLGCWTSLSSAQRQRRKWIGITEGGTADEAIQRRDLARQAWGTVRAMLFFLDQMMSHFMTDIIEVQHKRLLEDLDEVDPHTRLGKGSVAGSLRGSTRAMSEHTQKGSSLPRAGTRSDFGDIGVPETESVAAFDTQSIRSRVPPMPRKAHKGFLDFLTLRQMHTRHISFLREGLLISDLPTAALIRDILDVCKRFTGLVDRWGGDVLPEMLMEDATGEETGDMVRDRSAAVKEINENLHDLLTELFRALLESQKPPAPSDASTSAAGVSFSRTARVTQLSRMMSRQISFSGIAPRKIAGKSKEQIEKEERGLEAEALMGRHIEQLLLRLDFNGVLTDWLSKENDGVEGQDLLPTPVEA